MKVNVCKGWNSCTSVGFFCLFFFFFFFFFFLVFFFFFFFFFFVTSPENFLPSLKVYPFALCPSKLTLTIFLSVESKLREVILH